MAFRIIHSVKFALNSSLFIKMKSIKLIFAIFVACFVASSFGGRKPIEPETDISNILKMTAPKTETRNFDEIDRSPSSKTRDQDVDGMEAKPRCCVSKLQTNGVCVY